MYLSSSIGYFTESWSGYSGAGDLPYTQLDGTDLLPEILIGRISVNSNSDLNNVINKTIAYEKATYLSQVGTDWYERAALCGDPSSSGQSTIITNQYIQLLLDQKKIELRYKLELMTCMNLRKEASLLTGNINLLKNFQNYPGKNMIG